MFWRIHLFRLVALLQLSWAAADTNPNDVVVLYSLKGIWESVPPNWHGNDPCGSLWDGIACNDGRVTSINLASINLSGELSSEIAGLHELQHLDLSYNKGMTGPLPSSIGDLKNLFGLFLIGCGFSGTIPHSIGSLQNLLFLAVNSNNFIGEIPHSIGNLSKLIWLDLADNKFSGKIPVSTGNTPGLDMLVVAKHFHLGNNELTGDIPSQLFSSNMQLIHLLLDNNRLNGSIPSTMGLVQKLEVVQLNRNYLTGPVPQNLNNLTSVQKLYLANNKLTGHVPNLSGMGWLNSVDFSNNSFAETDVPKWFSSLPRLTSLIMEGAHIQGQLPESLFSVSHLQTIVLKNNQINGTLNISSSYSDQLKLIDLQNNYIDAFTPQQAGDNNVQIILVGNPICGEGVTKENYCSISNPSNSSYSTPSENCTPLPCSSNRISSPTCKCLYPYSGDLVFRAPFFSNFGDESLFKSLEKELVDTFNNHSQPVDSVSVSNPRRNIEDYLMLSLLIFPFGQDHFNQTGISSIGSILCTQTFQPPPEFGPFYFSGTSYEYFVVMSAVSDKSSSKIVTIGATVGGLVLVLLLLVAGVYAFRQKKLAQIASKRSDLFASWDLNSDSGGVPRLNGARCFSFEEIKKCTNNFCESNDIGSGGYGKVYRGILPDGQLVAIKRAHQRFIHGALEFKTEIEILTRVHHKNVVSLVGFCFNHGEQMLVYEYIRNGTLKESLNGKTGIRLDWTRRIQIALGAARGVQYLHELANPPIIHRDIKSNNILLDERLNAKVADFGICKPMVGPNGSHVTTQVKGTMGYMDPEYYMTQQLSDKSDVYSFGVVLLELLTSRTPLAKGKYIVREVKEAMDKSKNLYNLEPILDPIVSSNTIPGSIERFVDLALWCVEDLGITRPTMGEVVREIENIMEMACLNPNVESESTSDKYGGSEGSGNPYASSGSLITHSGGYSTTN